jgi:hypothetical protein
MGKRMEGRRQSIIQTYEIILPVENEGDFLENGISV